MMNFRIKGIDAECAHGSPLTEGEMGEVAFFFGNSQRKMPPPSFFTPIKLTPSVHKKRTPNYQKQSFGIHRKYEKFITKVI